MFGKFVLKGKYCSFDYSNYPGEFDRAEALLEYFDDKIPSVFRALMLDLPSFVINISFSGGDRVACCTQEKWIRYGVRNSRKDFGCLIHEAVHFAQSYDEETFLNNKFIAEGMADYFRVKLSNDCWDNPDDQSDCKHSNFDLDCYRCGSKFLMWLEEKSKDKNLAIKINNTLKENRFLDALFLNVFKKDLQSLLDSFV